MKVNWISCKDKLPEEYTQVWVAMPSKRCNWLIDIDYREGNGWHDYNGGWASMDISEPLFWAEIEHPDPSEV